MEGAPPPLAADVLLPAVPVCGVFGTSVSLTRGQRAWAARRPVVPFGRKRPLLVTSLVKLIKLQPTKPKSVTVAHIRIVNGLK